MSLRTWKWTEGGCHSCHGDNRDHKCDPHNGRWTNPERTNWLCWAHYTLSLREEANKSSEDVKAERKRIAEGLLGWHQMWSKPARIAFTDEKVQLSGNISIYWLKEFAQKIEDGTFGIPHGSEPDPVYRIEKL